VAGYKYIAVDILPACYS